MLRFEEIKRFNTGRDPDRATERQKAITKGRNFVFLLDRCICSLSHAVGVEEKERHRGTKVWIKLHCIYIHTYMVLTAVGLQQICNRKPLAKGDFQTVNKISLSHCILGTSWASISGCYSWSFDRALDLSTNELSPKFKAASLFFRAHTILILIGKMPFSHLFLLQIPSSHFWNRTFPSTVRIVLVLLVLS